MTKTDAVYEALSRQIISGERPYGQAFSTYELAEEFGVSRRPVMDAMFRLQAAGLVEIESQVGCRVVVPSKDDVREHVELVQALGCAAAKLAATRATPEARERMEAAYAALEPVVARNDFEAYAPLNGTFHLRIAEASGNGRLVALAERLWDVGRFLGLGPTSDDLGRLQREHRDILDAIAAGDGDGARAAVEAHEHQLERLAGQPEPPLHVVPRLTNDLG
jgi:DNA-binding GntR family transcriptional regulator